jgi:O-acetyl-ADP-ribose deacetylase (regulator of RNase III)
MIHFRTGDIFESGADALVNTVNCEGYMGKGIAYQFKVRFPKNNNTYIDACKKGDFSIGKILVTREDGFVILNFPTKNKWRNKSTYSMIEKGLNDLVEKIPELDVNSIAIPPLGCGNGGLDWVKVKKLIIDAISPFEESIDFFIYSPSNVINKKIVKKAPKLNSSHLVLMKIKTQLDDFGKLRLQKAAYFLNYFLKEEYFKFSENIYGPFANSINILSRDIKEFQYFYQVTTEEAFDISFNNQVSNRTIKLLNKVEPIVKMTTKILNKIEKDRDLELHSTILFLIEKYYPVSIQDLELHLANWSERKAKLFSKESINESVQFLLKEGLILKTLTGLEPSFKKKKAESKQVSYRN